MPEAEIGIIGGSGLYEMEEFRDTREVGVATPFGDPSDKYVLGRLEGRKVAFLPRHGRGHRFLPHEVNFRANICGMKKLGVKWVLSVSAVGSLKEELHPTEVVIPDQFYDRTKSRKDTFFGEGIAAHISFGDPICKGLTAIVCEAAREAGATVHEGGTYVNMEGPAFSTLAESNTYRSHGFDIIGMTNLTEAKLAREAEMCYVTLAMITDYDCWKTDAEEVSVEAIIDVLQQNARMAQRITKLAVRKIPAQQSCACGDALKNAIITQTDAIPEEAKKRLTDIIGRYLRPA
jgi:5'-methylthioadenosine phosphorylase